MPYVIQTNHLTKTIGGKEIVKDVGLHVKKGEIYGFLGPNGAGKTTVMKMILNLWKPTRGSIELFGENLTPKSYGILKRIGSIIEFPSFYERLTGRENLELHCEYMGYHHPGSVEGALEMLELLPDAGRPVKEYSLGMKERLGIARAVLCRPELLVLDEPTNGLDPAGMKHVRKLLRNLCSEYGMTVMVSSHILSEIESIADTVGILHRGELVQEVGMQMLEEMNTACIEVSVTDTKGAAFILSDKCGMNNFKIMKEGNIRIYDPEATVQETARVLAAHKIEVTAIGKKAETLEDYFLKITGEADRTCGN